MSKCILRWRSVTHTILGHCDLDLWPSLKNFCVLGISLIFFEVGIPNLVCICILGWWSLTYYFLTTVTLTSDLVLKIIVPGAYLIIFEKGIPNLACECILGWLSVLYHLRVTVTLTSVLVLIIIVSGAYLFYYLRKESQIWCVNTFWEGGVSCTIYRSLWPWPLA